MQFQTAGQDLLNQLLECQPNLAFTPMAMKKILFGIAQQNQKAWRFTDQDMEDFSSDVGQTLRTMCRHFAQAMSKNTRPKWVVQIVGGSSQQCNANEDSGELGGEGEEEEEEAAVLKKPAAATPVTFFVGYDPKDKAAWRATSSTSPR